MSHFPASHNHPLKKSNVKEKVKNDPQSFHHRKPGGGSDGFSKPRIIVPPQTDQQKV